MTKRDAPRETQWFFGKAGREVTKTEAGIASVLVLLFVAHAGGASLPFVADATEDTMIEPGFAPALLTGTDSEEVDHTLPSNYADEATLAVAAEDSTTGDSLDTAEFMAIEEWPAERYADEGDYSTSTVSVNNGEIGTSVGAAVEVAATDAGYYTSDEIVDGEFEPHRELVDRTNPSTTLDLAPQADETTDVSSQFGTDPQDPTESIILNQGQSDEVTFRFSADNLDAYYALGALELSVPDSIEDVQVDGFNEVDAYDSTVALEDDASASHDVDYVFERTASIMIQDFDTQEISVTLVGEEDVDPSGDIVASVRDVGMDLQDDEFVTAVEDDNGNNLGIDNDPAEAVAELTVQ